jgi:hypothetical protein
MSRRALNFMEVMLRTYYKCTLSVITGKLSVSRYMLIWIFLLFWCVELMPKLNPRLSVTHWIRTSTSKREECTRQMFRYVRKCTHSCSYEAYQKSVTLSLYFIKYSHYRKMFHIDIVKHIVLCVKPVTGHEGP